MQTVEPLWSTTVPTEDKQNYSGMDTINYTQTSAEGYFFHLTLQTGLMVDKYYTPLLCLLGAFGNSLSLVVFCMDAKYRRQSSSYYLSALAVSDSGFLLSLFAVWLEGVMGGVITSNLTCPLVMYLGQVTCFMSVYLTVGFSLERFIAINFPFSRPRICTRSKAKKLIAGITTVALLLFSYAWIIAKVIEIPKSLSSEDYLDDALNVSNNSTELFKNVTAYTKEMPKLLYTETDYPNNYSTFGNYDDESSKYVCTVPERYFKISEVANYLDSIITLIIPFLLITYFNVRIGISVWRLNSERQQFVASIASARDSNVILTIRVEKGNTTANDSQKQFHNDNRSSRRWRESFRIGRNSLVDQIGKNGSTTLSKRTKSSGHLFKTPGSNHMCNGKEVILKRNASLPVGHQLQQMNAIYSGCHQYQTGRPPSSEVRVTKTLLLVSTVFLALNLPLHVIRCTQFIRTATGAADSRQDILQALQPWANMLFNTNFAVNFLLYCVSGRNFRKSLQNIASNMYKKKNPIHTQEESRYRFSLRRKQCILE